MRKAVLAAVFLLVVALAAGGFFVVRSTSRASARLQDASTRFHTYCAGLRGQLDAYHAIFTYGDDKTKALVGQVFTNSIVFTQLERVDLCSSNPPDLHARDVCWVNADYACLAKLAAMARDAIDY